MNYYKSGCCLAIVVAMFLSSCTRTVYLPVEQRRSETVLWHDTVLPIDRPAETLLNTTIDTTSTLRTSLASSTATVAGGVLSHTLTVHPRSDSVVVRWREVHVVDSIPYAVPVAENGHHAGERRLVSMTFIACAVMLMGVILHRFCSRN